MLNHTESPSLGPGEPEQSHWAHGVYHRLRLHLQTHRGLAEYTVRNYLTDLAPFWRFLDSRRVQELTAVDRGLIREYLYWLLTQARPLRGGLGAPLQMPGSGRGYATPSVARKLSALRALFGFLLRQSDIPADPTSRVASAKREQRLPDFLDIPSTETLLKTPSATGPTGIRDRAILELLYAAGLRVSEVVGLDTVDLDLALMQVRVMGKGSRQRIALLGGPAREAMERYLRETRPLVRGHRPSLDADALFLNRSGGRLTQRSVQKLVHRYGVQAGLALRVHPHTLRHTFATHLLDGGADLRVVQELLGHATPATTQIYTHVTQAGARRVYHEAHPRARQGSPLQTPPPK